MSETRVESTPSDAARRVVRTLFEWPGTALLFFVLFAGFLMSLAYFFPPLYEVQALVLVKSGTEKAPISFLPQGALPGGAAGTTMEDLNSEIAILTSRPVIEAAVDRRKATSGPEAPAVGLKATFEDFQAYCRRIGLMPEMDEREQAILALQANLGVEPLPLSNVIEITFSSFNPRGAERTVNHVLDAYLEHHGTAHKSPDSAEFFARQASTFGDRLEGVQAELTKFRVDHEGGDLTLKRSLLLAELVKTEQQRRSLESVSQGNEEMLADASLLENRELSATRERLLGLKLALGEKRLLFAESSPEIQGLLGQIRMTRDALAEQMRNLAAILARSESDLRTQLQEVERARATYDRLVEDEARLETSFELYSRKAEEERITRAMQADEMSNVRVLQRATVPAKAFFPDRFLLAVLALLFGIPGAFAAALLRGYLHGRVSSVRDVEHGLKVPVLASVRRRPWWRAAWSLGARKTPPEVQGAARLVYSALELARRDDRAHIVHFSAATQREGAATLAAAVAGISASDHARKTALVLLGTRPDATRSGTTAQTLGELMATKKSDPERPGVDVYDLSSMRLARVPALYAALRERYERVFVAGLPLAGDSDGGAYATMADRSVFVVGGSGIHVEVARRALELLRRYSRDVAGAVLTQRRDAIPRVIYRWI
ncbi:MAG: GumC family protein [Planctomycetota bacterium]